MMRLARDGIGIGIALAMAGCIASATPAAAQMGISDSTNLLKGVRDRDAEAVQKLLDKPSNTIILTHDQSTGDTVLHIVTKRRDMVWMQYMLAKGADINARDQQGNTALADAAQLGYSEGARLLLETGAAVDLANNRGETPLILAVQAHDLTTVHTLIAGGADPAITDNVTGMSAHDYAARDGRSGAILKALDEAKPKPKKIISGPSIN